MTCSTTSEICSLASQRRKNNLMSPFYTDVKRLMKSGMSAEAMCVELNKPLTVIKRAITNLQKEGVRYKVRGPDNLSSPAPVTPKPEETKGTGQRVFPPRQTKLPQTPEAILSSIANEKPLEYDLSILEKVKDGEESNAAPMLLMGTTIAYIQLCGGRLKAIQTIEDVYAALKAFSK